MAVARGLLNGVCLKIYVGFYSLILKKKVVVINLIEHLGDIIACEPIVQYCREAIGAEFVIWCLKSSYADVLKCHPGVNKVWALGCVTEWIYARKFIRNVSVVDLHIEGRTCSVCGIPLIKDNNEKRITLENYYNFGPLLVAFARENKIEFSSSVQNRFYACPIETLRFSGESGSKYILIHRKSNEVTRDWNDKYWKKVVEYILSKSPLRIVEIGSGYKALDIDSSRYISYIGKTSIQESAQLVKNCHLFLGVDSSIAHVANAFQKPGLILLGKYRLFDSYIPYTGFYFTHREYIFSNSPKPLSEASVESVISRLEGLL